MIAALLCFAALGAGAADALSAADRDRLGEIHAQVRLDLRENVLPTAIRRFWNGDGFAQFSGRDGRLPQPLYRLLHQARMLWALSAAHRHGITDRDYLELAAVTYRGMTERLWDEEYDGFRYARWADGTVQDVRVRTYEHAFVIYGLAEYYLASKDPAALAWAERTYSLLHTKARVGDGDYHEHFNPVWEPHRTAYGSRRTLDTHMHLLEAFTSLAQATGKPEHRREVFHLAARLRDHAIHPGGAGYAILNPQWQPVAGDDVAGRMTTSYGHNAELAWLLLHGLQVLKEDAAPWQPMITGLVDSALRDGMDVARGGVAKFGPMQGRVEQAGDLGPDRLVKDWWEQAELLVALIDLYAWTGRRAYLDAFEKQWRWIHLHQIDRATGDWSDGVSWDGREVVMSSALNPWKEAYHTARALIRVEQRLQALGIAPRHGLRYAVPSQVADSVGDNPTEPPVTAAPAPAAPRADAPVR